MSESRVRNGADRQQVRKAEKLEKAQLEQERADLRAVLKTGEGRRMFHSILRQLQPRTQMWQPSAGIQFNAARYDVGSWLLDLIEEADPQAWIRMQQEALERQMASSIVETPKAKTEEDEREED